MWLTLAERHVEAKEAQQRAATRRADLEARMAPDELAEAKRLAEEWRARQEPAN